MTSDSLYSVSTPDLANEISKIIYSALPNIKVVVDATANIGGNTLSFSSYFKSVIAVEINKKTFDVLVNNIETYKRTNVETINDDFLNLIDKIKGDVIFMDPPWTGTFYKMHDKIDLFLSNVNIIDIIPKLKCRMVVLKLPLNYNIVGLLDKIRKFEIFKVKSVMLITIKK
jgi:predicted RNA methylase